MILQTPLSFRIGFKIENVRAIGATGSGCVPTPGSIFFCLFSLRVGVVHTHAFRVLSASDLPISLCIF